MASCVTTAIWRGSFAKKVIRPYVQKWTQFPRVRIFSEATQGESPKFHFLGRFFAPRGGGVLLGLMRYHRHLEWFAYNKRPSGRKLKSGPIRPERASSLRTRRENRPNYFQGAISPTRRVGGRGGGMAAPICCQVLSPWGANALTEEYSGRSVCGHFGAWLIPPRCAA